MKKLANIIGYIIKILPKTTIREIRDRTGKLYFKRNAIFLLPWVAICEHEFFQDVDDLLYDKDESLHSHPRAFMSLILEGGYIEHRRKSISDSEETNSYKPGDISFVSRSLYHSIVRLGNYIKDGRNYCRTLTVGLKHHGDWGYLVDGKHIPPSRI